MSSTLTVSLALLTSYLIGSIPTSFICAKVTKGIDIRQHGSRNVGATNVLRVVGKVPALLVLIIDILKGVFAVTIVATYFHPYIKNLDYGLYRAILGLAAICGHIWPVFLKFKGGKGVATTIGVIMIIAPVILLPSLIAWLIVFLATKYVSLASLVLGASFPISAAILSQPYYIVVFAVTICILNCYKHKDNIRRLLRGEESKTIIFRSS
ncbi:MAG: glycerol-3-phosphate 1-O-acyltransferase PlsY [Candidatus Omnitrophica bacterium]|nr:glycerol-3-phosphate 1-O-acyltransferase PlsY [Candidatus Omnitrophota bacterium]